MRNRLKHKGCQCGEKGHSISTQTEVHSRSFSVQTKDIMLSSYDKSAEAKEINGCFKKLLR